MLKLTTKLPTIIPCQNFQVYRVGVKGCRCPDNWGVYSYKFQPILATYRWGDCYNASTSVHHTGLFSGVVISDGALCWVRLVGGIGSIVYSLYMQLHYCSLIALSSLAKENNYCKPQLTEDIMIHIKQGRLVYTTIAFPNYL